MVELGMTVSLSIAVICGASSKASTLFASVLDLHFVLFPEQVMTHRDSRGDHLLLGLHNCEVNYILLTDAPLQCMNYVVSLSYYFYLNSCSVSIQIGWTY